MRVVQKRAEKENEGFKGPRGGITWAFGGLGVWTELRWELQVNLYLGFWGSALFLTVVERYCGSIVYVALGDHVGFVGL